MNSQSILAPNAPAVSAIVDELWRSDQNGDVPTVFALLDGARNRRIEPLVHNSGLENDCLFSGNMSYALRRAAPHIVKLERDAPFTENILQLAWGQSWGIFAIAENGQKLSNVRNRFRRIARVQGPNGEKLTFRYYDPRVMRVFLPTCMNPELQQIFGPLQYIMVENESASGLYRYSIGDSHNETPLNIQEHTF